MTMFGSPSVLAKVLPALLGATAFLFGTAAAPAQEMTVLTWGGVYEEATRAVVQLFERKTKIKVRIEIQENARFGLAKIRAQRNDPQIDVWFSVPDALQAATDDKLLQPLPNNDMPSLKQVPEPSRHQTWLDVGDDVYGITYRKDLVPFEPKTLDDLLDVRMKDKVISPTATFAGGLWIVYAALQHGGDERNVEPGFEYFRKLQPNVSRFFTTGPAAMKILQTGEAAVAVFSLFANLRAFRDDPAYKFVLPEGRVLSSTYSAGIVSPKQRADAARFVDFLATAEAQTAYCAAVLCIPTNTTAKAPPAAEGFRPDPKRLYVPDLDVLNNSLAGWDDRFKREIQAR